MKNRKCVLGILAVAILILDLVGYVYCEKLPLATSAPTVAAQRIIVVNSTSDSGPGTLRQALLGASSGDTITFDSAVFSPEAPAIIYLASSLPPVTQGDLTIDGSNAGVVLDGSMITDEQVNGLEIASDGNIIRGLQIIDFPNAAVGLRGGAENNIVGGDRGVGSGPLGQGNLLSGNGSFGVGIWDADTSFNTIIGNYIGTDLSGTAAWGIRRDGVHMNRASHNQVTNNLISGNGQSGVYICWSGQGNTIRDNHIGTDICGLNPLGNLLSGVCIDHGARDNVIGPNNIIAYNNEDGVAILGSDSFGNTITQNSIHDNGRRGIGLWEGGNTELRAPVIFDFDLAAGTVTGAACVNCAVEIFSDDSNEGEIYEGRTMADSLGVFTFNKVASFIGPHLTATATDADGNTSPFSAPTSGTRRSTNLQEGNSLPRTQLQPKQSRELEYNRIGDKQPFERRVFVPDAGVFIDMINNVGQKWIHLTIDWGEWDQVETTGEYSRYYIDPSHDEAITGLADLGIEMVYSLVFWDEEIQPEEGYARFKKEEEIQRYLDYAQFIVHNFKDRIQYYEMINEPRFNEGAPFNQQNIELADYIELARRTVQVIRQEYPEAKIVVGATVLFYDRDYFFGILESDIMPVVDAISWHPMYGTSPEYDDLREYYYNYPSIVQEIKDVASAHGFKGEYIAEEMCWRTPLNPLPDQPWTYSETVAAKYYARGIMMHLGMDVTAGLGETSHNLQLPKMKVIRNLCTIMAGAEPVSLPMEIQSEAMNIRSYSFSLPNGDNLIALWTDGVAVDEDAGVKANLTFRGFTARDVVGIDVLNGFEQPIISSYENGNLVIQNLLVRDYPLILRLSPVAKPAVFTDLTVNPTEAQLGQPVEISVKVTNVGGMESSYTVTLTINGVVEDTETITLAGGETRVVTFMVTRDIAGGYAVEVGGLTVTFTVVGPKPAEFVVTDLTVGPTEVKVKQEVKITVKVTNVGGQSGSYTVDLKIAGVIVDTKKVTLGGGESTTVTFELAEEEAGTYDIEVSGLKGTFIVKEVLPPAEFIPLGLTLSREEVYAGEEVVVSLDVRNIGGEKGSYVVELYVDGIAVDTKTVTLVGGESTTVTFKIVEEKAGVHNVEVAGLKGTFLVKEILPPPPPRELYATVAAVAIVAIGVSAMIYRRRRASAR